MQLNSFFLFKAHCRSFLYLHNSFVFFAATFCRMCCSIDFKNIALVESHHQSTGCCYSKECIPLNMVWTANGTDITPKFSSYRYSFFSTLIRYIAAGNVIPCNFKSNLLSLGRISIWSYYSLLAATNTIRIQWNIPISDKNGNKLPLCIEAFPEVSLYD